MNPTDVASAFVSSFEAQLTSHIAGDFPHGAELASLSTAQLAAVREMVRQAALNAATSIGLDVEEAIEMARAA